MTMAAGQHLSECMMISSVQKARSVKTQCEETKRVTHRELRDVCWPNYCELL